MSNKFILKSKTILGALLTFAIGVLPQLGVSFTGEDAALIAGGIDELAMLATTGLTVYGRFKADSGITTLGK